LAAPLKNLADLNSPGDLAKGIIRFHPWQERFFRDPARVIVAIWHRQAGKDFAAAAKAVDDAFRTGRPWFIVSLTQRQADATFDKARRIAEALKKVLKRRGELALETAEFREYDSEIDQWFRQTARTIRLPGGGSVTALPGRSPDTLAGLTGSVIFTEFGLMPKGGYDHWRVIFPLATRGYQILVISTPRGKNAKLYELYSNRQDYSVHFQTILDSVREGLVLYDNLGRPTTVENFKRLYGDDSGWRREYMCEFTGDMEALLKWALIESCSSPDWPIRVLRLEADGPYDPLFWRSHSSAEKIQRLEIGWDVARHSNFSAVWANARGRWFGAHRPLVYLVLMRECTFALQRRVLMDAMEAVPGSVGCGDATGLGMDSNETLSARYGGRWIGLAFTEALKRDLASGILTSFQDGVPQLPDSRGEYKFIHTDFYALQANREGRNLAIEYGENPLLPESHCDLAVAGELACEAARTLAVPAGFAVV
jgi:phage FluMu gp28-like protein